MFLAGGSYAQIPNLDNFMRKYRNVLYLMEEYYLDTVNVEKLVNQSIIAMMQTLDPHSYYISKEEYKAVHEPLDGNFEGIGIEFSILEDTLIVVSPLSGGPSERVGLLSRDRIIKVDGINIAGIGLTNTKVQSLLRGAKGTRLTVTIKRDNDVLDFEIVRDKIPINSVAAAYEVKPGIAYLKLSTFAQTSMTEIDEAFARFNKSGSLILDLRGNGGGFMSVAIELADQFLDAGKLIVYTEGMHVPTQRAISTNDGYFTQGNLVILIDEGSASASEIVSGAIQDWDRGLLIGRRSFGKGLVQNEFQLNDGSAIRLTIARYHTPSGRAIQTPYEKGKAEQYHLNRYLRMSSELFTADSITFPDSLKYSTLANNRVVYGGGGIMPDIYIPLDTSQYSKYSDALIRKGVIIQYVSAYMDKNKTSLQKKYPTMEKFKKSFVVDADLFAQLVAAGEKQGVPRDEQGIKISGDFLKKRIKALIARGLFNESSYFQIINEDDVTFNKAVEALENWKQYNDKYLKSN
jgi:carboxyl-terminal processing protease